MDLFARISIDPAVRFGKPCVRGTRLTVGDLRGTLAAGSTDDVDLPGVNYVGGRLSNRRQTWTPEIGPG